MKPKIKSKTLWFNWVLSLLISVAGVVTLYAEQLGLSAEHTAWVMMGLGLVTTIGNKVLRLKTGELLK